MQRIYTARSVRLAVDSMGCVVLKSWKVGCVVVLLAGFLGDICFVALPHAGLDVKGSTASKPKRRLTPD